MMSSLKALVATLVMPFPLFLALVATGLLLWMAGRRRAGGDRAPVARGYAQAARELGIPAARVTILDTPVDTAQEAYAVRAALGTEPRFVLVTSASHMPRAVRHFQWVGLDPLPAPTQYLTGRLEPDRLRDWIPSADHLRKTERAWYEYLGLLALRFDHPG